MKIVVLCDKKGAVQSVMIPNPKVAGQINVELEGGGTVHRLDVDNKTARKDDLLGKKGEEARKQAFARVQALVTAAKPKKA